MDKNIKSKNMLFLLMFVQTLMIACSSETSSSKKDDFKDSLVVDTIDHNKNEQSLFTDYKRLIFPIGKNQSSCEIGYWVDSNSVDEIGPKSFMIHNDNIYLVDTENSSVKKINILSGKIECKEYSYGDYKPILNDITYFNDMIIVSNSIDSLMIIDTNLTLLKNIHIGFGEKWFLNTTTDSLKMYKEYLGKSQIVLFDKKMNKTTYDQKRNMSIYRTQTVRGTKKYKFINRQFIIDEDTIKTNEDLPVLSAHFDAVNVDWNQDYLVYWNLDDKNVTFYIYKR